MADPRNVVSIHPYFKIHKGMMEDVKALLPEFVARVGDEEDCLYYDFTLKGDELFCREAYADAEGALAHIENVGEQLEKLFTLVALTRIELHGPATELEKLKVPLADLNPTFWEYQTGLRG